MTRQIAIIAFFLVAFSSDASDRKHLEHVARGDEFYKSFDNTSALSEYEEAYKLAPSDPEVLVRMIRIHNDIGRLMLWRNDSAEFWYSRAFEYASEFKEKHSARAEAYFWFALAEGSLVPFRGAKGKLDIGKSVADNAARALEIDSTFGPAYVLLGIVYREADRLKWYERLVANVVFGGSLPGTIEDSERVLRKAIELNPNDLFAHVELSRVYARQQKRERAIEHLKLVLSIPPASLREKNEVERAKRQLERMLSSE